MLVALADTHATADPAPSAHVEDLLAAGDPVIHAGDFTTPPVHDALADRATELLAVHGNSDQAALEERLPAVRTVEWAGLTILLVHGHDHDRTSLPLLARDRGADIAVVGHTHRPGIERLGDLPILNPGSHADPRGGPPTVATLEQVGDGATAEIRTVAGETVDRTPIGSV